MGCKALALGALLVTPLLADAALVDRGGGLIYDTTLNITWLQDANYAKTSGYDADGRMNFGSAQLWARELNYYGITGWRLPAVAPINGSTFNTAVSNNGTTDVGFGITSRNSEMAYMYHVNLGNLGRCTPNAGDPTSCDLQPGFGLVNRHPFTNLQPFMYWTGTWYNEEARDAWFFDMEIGYQYHGGADMDPYAWAVHDGDVAPPVPLPAAAWLLLSGLGGLGALGRRRKKPGAD